jgi:F420H(2)-dependent quinone reductase
VCVQGRWTPVRAREAVGAERARLWAELTAANRWLERAATKAGRELPVVVLEPGG